VKSRISDLMERIERGDDPTPADLRRLMQLQALDVVKAGEDYAKQQMEEAARRTEEFHQLLGD